VSRNANPVTVGAFVLVALALAVTLLLMFNQGAWWNQQQHYVLIYDRSIKGLNVGAPVTIKGVKIGEVKEITVRMKGTSVFNSVVIAINPDALERDGKSSDKEMMDDLIERGLRAQLRLQSLLTAMLYVDIDFYPDKQASIADVETRYKQIPTIPTDLEQLQRNLESIDFAELGSNLKQIVDGVNHLINDKSLQRLGGDISSTLHAVREAANEIDLQAERLGAQLAPLSQKTDKTLDEINRTLPRLTQSLDQTLATLQQTAQTLHDTADNAAFLLSEDSPLLHRLDSTAASVNAAANQLRQLTETLDNQPESIIFGKNEDDEP
jgi:paraquat-inducible protein B